MSRFSGPPTDRTTGRPTNGRTGGATTRRTARRPSTRTVLLAGLALSLVVAAVVSGWASSHPDGLEHVARSLGFADTARDPVTAGSPLADYAAPGVGDARLSGGLAGVVGLAVVAVVMAGVLTWLRRSPSDRER